MTTDSTIYRVARKELGLFFSSPVALLFIACFSASTLFIFFWVEAFFARNIADVRPLFEWMPILLLLLCCALTMRMWSEERSNGTLEHVLTKPARLWQFVLGKFFACFVLLIIALCATAPLPATVALIADLDWGPVLGGYVAAIFLGSMYLCIGLFLSATTNNAIVSLISSVALCSIFYLLGSTLLTSFFSDQTGDTLRLLGSGARFGNITRGIVDVRDLFYYSSISLGFLVLNVYVLERIRWAKNSSSPGQRIWRTTTALALGNLVLANIWLHQLHIPRLDLTENKLFSISQSTHYFLNELQEPLLIRGYFSDKTHPLLAPLTSQLRDLLKEYEVAGAGKVKVEFVDPALNPEQEKEANAEFGIASTAFRIADRHQIALVNAYFDVLVRYGSEHQALGFSDLIEVHSSANQSTEIALRNPEYNITKAVKKVLLDYQSGGGLFEHIDEPVELIAYVSADHLLPQKLRDYKNAIRPQLELAARKSAGKFSVRFIEPEARNGKVAKQIQRQWGIVPMVAPKSATEPFFFYLTLADSEQVVQIPTADFNPLAFRLALDAGLRRFTSGLTETVALSAPSSAAAQAQYAIGGPSFNHLKRAISQNYNIQTEDLSDGMVAPDADILAVIAPQNLDKKSIFAIDQFLMRGGTVILSTSPFSAEPSSDGLHLNEWHSGLEDWLAFQGLSVKETLVLDRQNTQITASVTRQSGAQEFREAAILDYPYFIDLRAPGLAPHAITTSLPQVTMAWASPITLRAPQQYQVVRLLQSSTQSWHKESRDIMPTADADGTIDFDSPFDHDTDSHSAANAKSSLLGVSIEGRFKSFFGATQEKDLTTEDLALGYGILAHSPKSARIVLYASNDFMSDRTLNSIVTASGTQYLGPIELFMNTLDWSLQNQQLPGIRSGGHFNRTLPPMERPLQSAIEKLNYAAVLIFIMVLGAGSWLGRILKRRYYAKELSL